ncbi:Hypothetical predicted protein [Paramuricea clavata]|uniref:Uncharacterized protein n=1 Tax=Paramuricea clavata TaxID=317549 RepID=A0A7D9DG54_PARCT|nr:Hypothetical predicted protein [Paramuricea clavata]
MLWRVFQGCGHSFHIQCTLPDISVCQICKNLLTTKVSSLGKTANEAVHHFDPSAVQESVANSSDEDEDRDNSEMQDQDADDEELIETTNTQTVLERLKLK